MTGGISEVYGTLDGMGLAALVRKGEVSPSEVIEEAIRRAEAVNGELNFLTYKAYEEGRKMAADPALPDGPFKGIPWLVKEIATDWTGLQNTNACPYFKDVVSTSDNEQVRRVKQAGFVLLGKSNSPEAGWALSTEPKMYGPTVNPWDTTRTPGGSSGGSAAAVARPAFCRWRKPAMGAAPSARRRVTPASSASSPRVGASPWRRGPTSGTAA